MPFSGLVLTLEPGSERRVADALGADPRLTLGASKGSWLPIAAETRSLVDGEELVAELVRTPGVLRVDVVSIDFDDDPVVDARESA